MRTRHTAPRTRPVLALLMVAATVFLLLGRSCGILGALIAGSADRLLGAAGLGLLCCTTWMLAFILATPPGTLTRMVVALWRAAVTKRHTPSVVVMKTKSEPVSAPAAPTANGPTTVRERRALDDVRTALKGLGYYAREYEPIVQTLDPALPLEVILRSAIKTLHNAKVN